MTELTPPDGVEALIVWLSPLGETRSQHPTGAVLPFIMVRRSGGDDDGLTDFGRYSIHVLDKTEEGAKEKSDEVTRRMNKLAGRFVKPAKVTIEAGEVEPEKLRCIEGFRPQDYINETIPQKLYRLTAIYEVPFRFVAS